MGEQNVIKFPQRAGLVERAEENTSAPYDVVYLKDTDIPLPATINYRTRYAYFKTIARRQIADHVLQRPASFPRRLLQNFAVRARK